MDIKVRQMENVTILELAGSLDISNAYQVRQVLANTMTARSAQVVINVQELNFVELERPCRSRAGVETCPPAAWQSHLMQPAATRSHDFRADPLRQGLRNFWQ